MPKIESVDHLNEYRRKLKATRDAQQPIVLVCGGPGCLPLGSEEVAQAFQEAMAEKGFDGKVILKTSGCQGLCAKGVKVLIRPEEIAYQRVTPQDVPEIVETTLVSGVVVDRLVYQDPVSGESCVHKNEVPFYQGQDPIVLRKLDRNRVDEAGVEKLGGLVVGYGIGVKVIGQVELAYREHNPILTEVMFIPCLGHFKTAFAVAGIVVHPVKEAGKLIGQSFSLSGFDEQVRQPVLPDG